MRPQKSLPRKSIVAVYGNWDAVKTSRTLLNDPRNKVTVYYYRYEGRKDGLKWFPTTRENLIKRGIINV